MRDIIFLSGDFFETPIPRNKFYLLKYFTTDIQLAFLRYYFVFGDFHCFSEHTGHAATRKYIQTMEQRLQTLMDAHDKAKKSMDMDVLYDIESGRFKL